MMDRRFPQLRRAHEAHMARMSDGQRADLVRIVDEVCRRRMLHGAVNVLRRKMVFWRVDPSQIVAEVPVFRPDGHYGPPPMDEILEWIDLGRVPMRIKERERAWRERSERHDEAERRGRAVEAGAKRAEDKIRHTAGRRGMYRKARLSAVVDGLKGE